MPITTTWTPPEHFVSAPIDDEHESTFDADTLEASTDDKELWLIRIPDNVNAADLDGITLQLPSDSTESIVEVSDQQYNVHCMGSDASAAVGGREMRGMHCLVPSEDKLVLAPMPFTRHITLTHAVNIPSSKPLAKEIKAQTIQKRLHPEGMKMQFPLSCIFSKTESTTDNKVEMETDQSPRDKKKHKSHHSEVETPKKKKKKSKH
ncbi:hypothetical protein BDF19DRAFT_426489 [Syncephalis fuscata]|nr:hypothetical protein BDF19DRAFT_426489 [Syncephalis fuscata]